MTADANPVYPALQEQPAGTLVPVRLMDFQGAQEEPKEGQEDQGTLKPQGRLPP